MELRTAASPKDVKLYMGENQDFDDMDGIAMQDLM
ncbi:hypothetical protein C806_00619 [Lachnospiraceae bacterium 3-1]|nr:hypothetical protein C806_00619 [Lachnospiraceae bacterium 3-1]